ncbi:MAG: LptM family lipoprotein [Planctomycetota bacterium]|jgi:iron(III) transport system substrate-binding protein
MKKTLISVLVIFYSFLVAGCGQKDTNEVVVYVSEDQVFSEPILKEFETDTGIRVKAVYDTEETKSTGVMNRLIAEKGNPRGDESPYCGKGQSTGRCILGK